MYVFDIAVKTRKVDVQPLLSLVIFSLLIRAAMTISK